MSSNSIKSLSKHCHLLRIPESQSQSLFKVSDSTNTHLANQQQWGFFTRSFHQFCRFKDPHKISLHSSPKKLCSPRSCSSSTSSLSVSKVGFLGWYLGKLESKPIITKSITTSLIYAAADITSQMISSPSAGSLDIIRTLRMAVYGLLILGPSQHLWFNSMSKILPKRDMLTTFKKILMGQALYGPCITTVFFSYNAALQGESGSEIAARLKRDLLPTLINGLAYWPICDFFTFKLIPVHLQPLVNGAFAYLWTIYLTYMASLKSVTTT